MSNQIELRHIRYFLAVAEDLHFRKAAERLYISQPGLSRQIKQMEDELEVKLFERHNRKVKLTIAGEYLKEELKHHLRSIGDSFSHAKLLDSGSVGNLKFGYVGSAMQEVIPDLLLKFRKIYPDVLFNLSEMGNQQQIEDLRAQEIDLGFIRQNSVPRGLKMHPVLTENFCLALPLAHPIAQKNFKNISQFKNESFILFDKKYSDSYFDQVMQIFETMGTPPQVSHSTIHASSIYKLIENGFGISIVPKSLTSKSVSGVKFIELNNIPQKTILYIAWNIKNRNPLLEQVLELIDVKRAQSG